MRKVKLLNGRVQNFWVENEKNPCNCGSNVFHLEQCEGIQYGVCNSCGKDIYIYDELDNFSEWKFKDISSQKKYLFIKEVETKRKKRHISTRDFAIKCGLTPSRYCDIKFGRDLPNDKELNQIENVLKYI